MKPHNPVFPANIGGEHAVFVLAIAQLMRLEAETDIGLERLFKLIAAGEARIPQTAAVLRLGLIGGGMVELDAQMKVAAWLESVSMVQLRVVAASLLSHALTRPSADEVDFDALGKAQGEPGPSGGSSPADSKTGRNSSETARPSRSRRKPSGG